jgi:hypothetical protein
VAGQPKSRVRRGTGKEPADAVQATQCTARRKRDGGQCEKEPIPGGNVCRTHGGAIGRVAARAAVVHEIRQWGMGEADVDPGEVLLRLLSQAAARAQLYATELAETVNTEGLANALVGKSRVPTESGSYISGEYIRGLAMIEAQERDRAANFAVKAIAAGLARRQIALAEQTGMMIADVLRIALSAPELGLTEAQRAIIPMVMRRAQAQIVDASSGPASSTPSTPTALTDG